MTEASEHEPPGLVRLYLERSLPRDGGVPEPVRITQEGQMWQKPRGRAMRFEPFPASTRTRRRSSPR